MKLYHAHTYQKLGFDVILRHLAERVSSEEAQAACLAIVPSSDPEHLMPELRRVEEFRQLMDTESSQPAHRLPAVSPLLRKIEVAGNWLSVAELSRLLGWLETIVEVRAYVHQRKELYPELDLLVNRHGFNAKLTGRIQRLLDPNGNLRDDASPALASLRKQLTATANELRNTLYRLLRRAQEQGWGTESEIVLRNDRLVIPLKAEAKNQMAGFIQDVSNTGSTVYLEPAEALPLNNRIRELQVQEHNEVIRILKEVTSELRQYSGDLEQFRGIMLQLDLIRAKARLAQTLGACLPTVVPRGKELILRDAYYPLLLLKAKQEQFEVVPADIRLNPEHRILLISGPNAGGKSVSLKTTGLLQLMLQSGMLVPVNEGSTFRLFDSLFLDIGDEQSVDTDLSTYTSRLFAWRQMGDHMTKNSLFLIDEFGAGTDPKQGGAIAEAFLERFVIQRAYGVITTHYGNLKDYAELTDGIINGAMQFDTQELRPTYRLLDGMPGRSYAFEMAKRVGVHPTVLRRAKRKVGGDELDAEQLRKELEQKTLELESLVRDNQRRQHQLDQLLARNEEKEATMTRERKQLLNDAKREAKVLIEQANKHIERTIREIRESAAEKEQTKRLRKQLAASAPEVELLEAPPQPSHPSGAGKQKKLPQEGPQVLAHEAIAEGDWVKLKAGDTYGQLVEIQRNQRGVVLADSLRLTVKLNQLVKIKPPKRPKRQTSIGMVVDELPAKSARFELDVMGMRVEAALPAVDRLIDDARMAGLHRVRVLHGKGTGALREAIREHLRDLSYVDATHDAAVEEGGAGWTIVDLAG
jgi:DNA mismatch repair protein MutS2